MVRLIAIITAYNRADFITRCIESVLDDADEALEVQVIVMDNGSTDSTGAVAAAVDARVQVERTADNRHIVEVINRGFAAAAHHQDVDQILLLNDDTAFTPGSLRALVNACDRHPDAVLTPLQLNYRKPQQLDDNALEHVKLVRPLIEDAVACRPLKEVYPLPTIIGAAMLAKRYVWENIGEFDTLFWFYGVDDDICTRARYLGYEILLAPAAHLWHAHGKLAQEQTPTRRARYQKWRRELQARYLFLLKDPKHSLARNYLRAVIYALELSVRAVGRGWLRGAIGVWVPLLACLMKAAAIAAARRRHFVPSRQIKRQVESEASHS